MMVGIGRKIEVLVLEYVFNALTLNNLLCQVLVENEKVIKLHKKFGFKQEAYYKKLLYEKWGKPKCSLGFR